METLVLEPQNVGLYTLGEGEVGLKKCTVYTLMKMLNSLDGSLSNADSD